VHAAVTTGAALGSAGGLHHSSTARALDLETRSTFHDEGSNTMPTPEEELAAVERKIAEADLSAAALRARAKQLRAELDPNAKKRAADAQAEIREHVRRSF